jgi:glycerophosphoryl diester phosphodiesterase
MPQRTQVWMAQEIANDFRRTWPQLALTDLLARSAAVILSIPATAVLLKLFLLRVDDGVLTDTDIATFLLGPLGMTAGLIMGAIGLGLVFAESGALMVIAFGAAENRRVTWLDALRYIASHGRQVVILAGRLLAMLAIVAAPFGLALVGIYRRFLGAHDINFYLTDRPPEFRTALIFAGIVVGLLAIVVLRLGSGWILGLPLVLFDGRRGNAALADSARILAGRQWSVALLLGTWIGAFVAFSWLVTFVLGLLGRLLVPNFGDNLTLVAAGLVVTLLVVGLSQLGLAFLATVLPALLLVRMFRDHAGPGRFSPPIADRGSLGRLPRLDIPGKWLLAGSGVTVLLLIVGGDAMMRTLDAQEDVVVIAHRGASGAAPENTMAAFQLAITDQADWIELDVQEDADGVVVIAHDSDFMKVAGNKLKVWDATAETLRDLDIGSWFDPKFEDQRVVTLEEVLQLAKGRIGVVIELKYYGHDQQLESRVVEVVEATGMADNIMLMSLKREGLRKAAELQPDWTRGLLNTVAVGDLTRLDLDFLALNAAAARTSTIRRAHKRDMQVFVWTIDDPVQMSVMMSRGVDGIITDHPTRVREVIKWRDQLGPFGRLLVWVAGETGLLQGVEESSSEEDA